MGRDKNKSGHDPYDRGAMVMVGTVSYVSTIWWAVKETSGYMADGQNVV